jgi:uncharacterized membrane protein (UPF0127 family)
LATSSAVFVTAAPASPAWRYDTPFSTDTAVVTVGSTVVRAEIADTRPLQTRGLGYRDGLREGWGMLFDFGEASTRGFWMKGMRFCLDIIWIEGGQVVGAAERVCPLPGAGDEDLPSYYSPVPVRFVLEMPAGWLDSIGAGTGTPVAITLPPAR